MKYHNFFKARFLGIMLMIVGAMAPVAAMATSQTTSAPATTGLITWKKTAHQQVAIRIQRLNELKVEVAKAPHLTAAHRNLLTSEIDQDLPRLKKLDAEISDAKTASKVTNDYNR